jgi:SAM-dependent methyltransferase
VNESHLSYLSSAQWQEVLRRELVPWLESVVELGDDVLEIGPGPGLTTDVLRTRCARLTAIEVDGRLAAELASRLAGTNVTVIAGDASTVGLPAHRFSTATGFSMLHHMTTVTEQDALFAAVAGALRPEGCFLGVDSLDTDAIRAAHRDDVFVPVDPSGLPERLRQAGFRSATIEAH